MIPKIINICHVKILHHFSFFSHCIMGKLLIYMLFIPLFVHHNMRCTCLQFLTPPPPGRIPKKWSIFPQPFSSTWAGEDSLPRREVQVPRRDMGREDPSLWTKNWNVKWCQQLGGKNIHEFLSQLSPPPKKLEGVTHSIHHPQTCGNVNPHTTSHASPIFGPLIWY